jgi:hypothetical protein
LQARVDEIVARMTSDLEVREVTEQLAPERARSCRYAITMASVMVDEIRLRADARPLDEPPGDVPANRRPSVAAPSGYGSGGGFALGASLSFERGRSQHPPIGDAFESVTGVVVLHVVPTVWSGLLADAAWASWVGPGDRRRRSQS